MASIVGIANRAIQKIGAQRILALDANQREARAINACYDAVREALLRKYRWKFAKVRVQLAADAAVPAYGYTAQVTLPADCVRPLLPRCDPTDRKLEGRKILTNYSDGSSGFLLNLEYISDVTDPNLMDPSFRECLAHKIAIEICDEITAGVSRKRGLLDEWKDIYSEAALADSFEDPPAEDITDTWITVRSDGFSAGLRRYAPVPSAAPPATSVDVLFLDGLPLSLDGELLSLV